MGKEHVAWSRSKNTRARARGPIGFGSDFDNSRQGERTDLWRGWNAEPRQALQETNDRLRGRETTIRTGLLSLWSAPLRDRFVGQGLLPCVCVCVHARARAFSHSLFSSSFHSFFFFFFYSSCQPFDANANSRFTVLASCQIAIHSIYKSFAADYTAGNVYPEARTPLSCMYNARL